MAIKNFTASALVTPSPVLDAPVAGFYSRLAAGPLVTGAVVFGTPRIAAFRPWTLPVNWERPVTEEVAYRTEVITSRDGTEQRIAQRVNPRYSFQFGVRVGRDRAPELERLLAKRHAYNFGFPHPRAATLQERSHPAAAGFIGRFDGESVVSARTDRVLDHDVRVMVNPGTYVGDFLVGYEHPAADTFHNGREVLTLKPNWAEPVRLNFGQFTEILDRLRGPNDFNTPQRFTTRLIQIGLMIRNEAQENRLRGLFERVRGQQGEFYMVDPITGQIAPNANIPASATFFTVPGRGLFDRFESEAIYRNVAIRTSAGMIYRRVSGISLVSGNSRVTLASALPEIQQADIIGVHWLLKVRFASDTLVLSWETDATARTTINLRALEDV
jgi:hypothetical protein